MKTKKRLLTLFLAILALCLSMFALTSCKSCKDNPQDQVPTEVKLVSISMDTKPTKLVYEIGEEVDTSGMKVTAKFSDETTKDVTSQCTTSMDGQKIKAETTSYFVKYTYEKVTKTVRVDITVNKEDITITDIEDDTEYKEPYLVAQESTADMVFVTSVDSGTMQIDGVLELMGTVASGTFTYYERNDYLGEITDINGNPLTAADTGLTLSRKLAYMTGTYATSDGEMLLRTKTISHLRTGRVDNATVQVASVITDDNGEVTGINFGSMVKDGKSSLFFGWGKANASAFTESNAQNFELEPHICYFSRIKDGAIPSNIRMYHAPVASIEIEQAPVKTEYALGEAFSSIGMSLRVNFEAGKSIVVTEGYSVDKDTLAEGDTSVTVSYYGYYPEAKTCTLEITVQSAYEEGLYAIELAGKITDFSYTYGEYQTLTDVLKASAMTVTAKYVDGSAPDKLVTEYTAVGYDEQGNAIEGNKITPDLKYYEVSYTEGERTVKTSVNVSSISLRTPYNAAEASDADYVFYASFKLSGRSNNTNHDVVITMTEGETANAGTFLAQMYVTSTKGICIIGTYAIDGDSVALTASESVPLVGETSMYSAVNETAEFVKNESGEIIGLDFGEMSGFFGLNPSTDKGPVTDNSAESIGMPAGNACLVRILNHDMGELNTHYGNKIVKAEAMRFTVNGVDIEDGKVEIIIGETLKLLAAFTPGDTTEQRVTWTFEGNDGIVAFEYKEGYGFFTALKAGEITVTATSVENPGLSVTCTVKAVPVPVTGVTLDIEEATMEKGETRTLTATVEPENATDKNVTWSSDNEEVATVDENGVVTAVGAGTATITVTTADGGQTATCAVTVKVTATAISLNKTELELNEGNSETLTVSFTPEDATNKKVTWESDDEDVATVDEEGKVTAVALGTATITATSEDGEFTATCAVTVTAVRVTGVTLDEETLSMLLGPETKTLTATIEPENATDKSVTWSSDNEEVVTVDENGVITAVAEGTATITVTTTDGNHTATCEVTVVTEAIKVTGVTLNQTELSLNPKSQPVTLKATVAPAGATNKAVTWKSSNEAVVTVVSGVVTVVGAGEATVTVTTVDGEHTATCAVTVAAVKVTGVTLDIGEATIEKGETKTLTATVAPENATNDAVIWSSSDNNVATVKNGVVTAVGAGKATITVTTEDGAKTATCAVTVKISVKAVSLNKDKLTLNADDEETLTVSFTPADATNKNVTWSSNNEEVATVDENGKVTAVSAGTATITVTSADGAKTARCEVTVKIPVTAISLNKEELELNKGSNETLTVTFTPEDATDKTVSWVSSDVKVATVVNGKVTAVGAGEATITATSTDGGFTATCKVTVNVPVTAISLKNQEIGKGYEVTLTVTFTPADATNKNVTWVSDNEEVATVVNGVVTAVGAGEATITATSEDGGFTATSLVTVKSGLKNLYLENKVYDFELTPYEILNGKNLGEALAAKDFTVKAQYYDKDVEDKDVTSSSVFEARDVDDNAIEGNNFNDNLYSYMITYTEGEGENAVTKGYRMGGRSGAPYYGDGEISISVIRPYEVAATSTADLATYAWYRNKSGRADVSIELFYAENEEVTNIQNGGTFIIYVRLDNKNKVIVISGTFTVSGKTITFKTSATERYNPGDSGFLSKGTLSVSATIIYGEDETTVTMLDFGEIGIQETGFFDTDSSYNNSSKARWTEKNCNVSDTYPQGSIGETIGDKKATHMYTVVLKGYEGEVKSYYSEDLTLHLPQTDPDEGEEGGETGGNEGGETGGNEGGETGGNEGGETGGNEGGETGGNEGGETGGSEGGETGGNEGGETGGNEGGETGGETEGNDE